MPSLWLAIVQNHLVLSPNICIIESYFSESNCRCVAQSPPFVARHLLSLKMNASSLAHIFVEHLTKWLTYMCCSTCNVYGMVALCSLLNFSLGAWLRSRKMWGLVTCDRPSHIQGEAQWTHIKMFVGNWITQTTNQSTLVVYQNCFNGTALSSMCLAHPDSTWLWARLYQLTWLVPWIYVHS